MFQYHYYRAETVREVCETLKKFNGHVGIVAGGTDIMVQIREKDSRWKNMECLLDISFLQDELGFIKEEEKQIHIGALNTHTNLEKSECINRFLPFLSEACSTVGSPQIRNRGTIGGSICNASPAADPLTPLIAAGADVVIWGMNGERQEELRSFYKGKGKVDLGEDEFVKGFIVPKLPEGTVMKFGKLGRRKALAISRLNVSAAIKVNEDERITFVRIAPGCIFAAPDRVEKAEQLLMGEKVSKELFKEAGKVVADEMIERTGIRWSTQYKQPAVEGIVEETLIEAAKKVVSRL